ncbi:YHS domain-containing (seleno)protein [Reichenbachiella sp. MALMAid0571]|uniref:YHS domain-containing (seleno)protein n=1 Tax=Reichenbachiella sp. MALMAid0571 TaxID=3143939 RepID=UPI0032E03A16
MRLIILSVLILLFYEEALLGQITNLNLDKSNKAIQGYDPVSYFTENKAIKGSREFALSHQGVVYWFKNLKNKNEFQKDPSKFQIAYGGWCAYAMGESGNKVKIDPETFKLVDGKLLLFYNFYFTNTLTKWNEDESNLKVKADENWKKTIDF